MPPTPPPHDPRSKEQSARRVFGTFAALMVVAVLTIALFATLILLIARSKGFPLFG